MKLWLLKGKLFVSRQVAKFTNPVGVIADWRKQGFMQSHRVMIMINSPPFLLEAGLAAPTGTNPDPMMDAMDKFGCAHGIYPIVDGIAFTRFAKYVIS